MQTRMLGQTGLRASIVGFGASALGNVFGEVSRQDADRAVASAIDRGINLFDVSPYYGLKVAEQRLGQAMVGRRPSILLGTKCGRYGAAEFDFSAGRISEGLEQSLRRLKTDYVDILQVHDIEFGDLSQIVNETVPAMRRLQQQGKVRHLGVTGYWPGLLALALQQTGVEMVLNYCHANLFVDDIDHALVPAIRHTGAGLLNASPLHMGLLGARPIPAWHPAPPSVRHAAERVRALCAAQGVDPAMLALGACLNHPDVTSTFVGFSTEQEVASACAAVDWTPPAELLAQVQAVIDPVRDTIWPSGLPQNQDARLGQHYPTSNVQGSHAPH